MRIGEKSVWRTAVAVGVIAMLPNAAFAEMNSRHGARTVSIRETDPAELDCEVPAGAAVATVDSAAAGVPSDSERYAMREAQSPEVQDYAGGEVVIGISLLAIALIVLIVILLTQ